MRNKRKIIYGFIGESIVVAILALIVGYVFRDVLFGGWTFVMPPDTSDLIYPNYYFIADSIKNGIFPLWDPHLLGGFSLAGYPQYGLFYPLNILFWIFPYGDNPFPPYAYEYLVIFHIFLAGWFMYWLGRGLNLGRIASVAAGVIYMLSPTILKFIVWGNAITAFSWFPLVFLFAWLSWSKSNRVYALLSGLFLGVLVLASPAQPAIQVLFLVFLLYLYLFFHEWLVLKKKIGGVLKKLTPNLLLIMVPGLLIAAPSLLPILEFSPYSMRYLGPDGVLVGNAKMSIEAFTHYTVPFKNLLGLVVPSYATSEVGNNFFGLVPLLFSIVGSVFLVRRKRLVGFFIALCVLSLLYAFGVILPYVFYYLPILDKIREPQRYLILVVFAVSVLAGYGISYVFSHDFTSRFKPSRIVKAAVFVSALIVLAMFWYDSFTIISTQLLAGGIILLLLALLFSVRHRWAYSISLLRIVVVVAITIELVSIPVSLLPLKDGFNFPEYASSQQALQVLLPVEGDMYRTAAVESVEGWPYSPNAADMLGGYDIFGYANPVFYDVVTYRNKAGYCSNFYDIMNVRYLVTDDRSDFRMTDCGGDNVRLSDIEGVQVVDSSARPYNQPTTLHVYENTNRMGYAWVVDNVNIVGKSDLDPSIQAIESQIDIRDTVIIERRTLEAITKRIVRNDAPLEYSIDLEDYLPNSIKLSVDSNKDGILVLSELYYPGWKARVDGSDELIFRANHILRGVFIHEGRNVVELRYSPFSVKIGLLLSIITLMVMVWFLLKEFFTVMKRARR